MSTGELALALRDQILSKHRQCIAADEDLRNALANKLNSAREVGILLSESRDSLAKHEFNELIESIALSDEVIHRYKSFAYKHPDPIFADDFSQALHQLKTVLEATGALPLPSGHGPQIVHGAPPFFSWTSRTVMGFKVRFSKFISARPLDTWTKDEAAIFLYSLQPILNVAKRIHEWIRTQR